MANSESTPPQRFGQRRLEAILAGLPTKADLEVAIATAAADLATKADLASFATKVSRWALDGVVNQRTPLSGVMALRIEQAFGRKFEPVLSRRQRRRRRPQYLW